MSELEQWPDAEWPDEQHIDAIGQNGFHYETTGTAGDRKNGGEEQLSVDCGWRKVVFAADCDEFGNCPACGIDYAECDCTGPTQEGLCEYRECDHGELWARPLGEDNPD